MSNTKPKNCSKVKNACKYCLEQVTAKNGLQCQGACKKWAHFKCLNFTPGKISDVKAGIIKVMCPCPDCETTQVKEFLTNPPYSCSNNSCPANATGPIKCESDECPSNRDKKDKKCSNRVCATDAEFKNKGKRLPPPPPRYGSPSPQTCMSPKKKRQSMIKSGARETPTSSGSCQNLRCKSSSQSICGEDGDPRNQASMVQALQEMCGTVGKLSVQLKDLMGKLNKL